MLDASTDASTVSSIQQLASSPASTRSSQRRSTHALEVRVNEILNHLLPAAAVGGGFALLQHQLFERC